MRVPSILAFVVVAAGCYSILGPELTAPPDAEPTAPLPEYATWYAQVEQCTGVTGSFSAVRWFAVPHLNWWDPVFEQHTTGTWREPHDIYLAEGEMTNARLVKHEMVHDLLQGGYVYDPRFERCSGLGHR